MRSRILAALPFMVSAFAYPIPATAQVDARSVADAFLEALKTGDVDVIKGLLTPDAMFAAGDVGGPLAGAEAAFTRSEIRKCIGGPLTLKTGATNQDLFGNHTPPSIKAGGARTLEGVLSCHDDTGRVRETPMTLVVAGARVAFFGLEASKK